MKRTLMIVTAALAAGPVLRTSAVIQTHDDQITNIAREMRKLRLLVARGDTSEALRFLVEHYEPILGARKDHELRKYLYFELGEFRSAIAEHQLHRDAATALSRSRTLSVGEAKKLNMFLALCQSKRDNTSINWTAVDRGLASTEQVVREVRGQVAVALAGFHMGVAEEAIRQLRGLPEQARLADLLTEKLRARLELRARIRLDEPELP